MKKIDFRQRAAKTEERKRKSKYADVMVRATVMGLMKPDEDVDRMMDIESADKKFNMRLDEWLNADDFNFAHDFYGIVNNINREKSERNSEKRLRRIDSRMHSTVSRNE